ncbi:ribosomal-processing cysteine protease Prp [Enterococcus bulliens]|uniref:ribosomal-processing cysteine protease Prp n=1 Tax=uncultured Enterococcus sp. TaxID=167972 RepID=UPI0025CE5BE3|nr:ribosomal-processing cysteine protease Prp [uncultured Enterococcus sp.]
MINGTFNRDASGRIVAFELSGHANAGEYGMDIVCAAVSALSISTVNGIEALAGFEPNVVVDNEAGGYLSMELPFSKNQEQTNIAQILLENLLLGLQAVQNENSDSIQIKTQIIK